MATGLARRLSGLLGLALIACVLAPAAQAREVAEPAPFYIAPMLSYGFFNESNFNPGDQAGTQLNLGLRLGYYIALEGNALYFKGVNDDRAGDHDIKEYGFSSLYFPLPRLTQLYLAVGFGTGKYDFNNTPGIGDQDSDYLEYGLGYLFPLHWHGVSIRADYRRRKTSVNKPSGNGDYNFRANVVSVGLQIPFGGRGGPVASREEPTTAPPPAPRDSDGDGVHDPQDQCPSTPPNTPVDASGCPQRKSTHIVLKGVHFQFNSERLTADARERLDSVVDALQSSPGVRVRVEGYTDSVDSRGVNLALSRARARAVRDYLVAHGIEASRLSVKGFGESHPVAPNNKPNGADNPAGRARNRRVELHVIEQ